MLEVKVLGTGCRKCKKLYEEATKAVAAAGVEAQVIKVEKIDEIASFGIVITPALVINGQIKAGGNVPKADQIVAWLRESAG